MTNKSQTNPGPARDIDRSCDECLTPLCTLGDRLFCRRCGAVYQPMPQVLNMRIPEHRRRVELGLAKRADRQTKWGNPFIIGRDGSRDDVIAKHKAWLAANFADADFEELRGWDLACWCWPEPCHCDEVLRRAKLETLNHIL